MNEAQTAEYIRDLDARAEHRTTEVSSGRSIRWRLFGSGDPLLLLHGGHGSWLHWIRNIEALAAQRLLLIPDLPGFGESDEPPESDGIEQVAHAVAASADSLLGSRAALDIAGFSFGAVAAAHIGVLRGCVRRLALLGSPGTGTLRRPRGEMLRWRDAATAAQNAALRNNMLAHMLYAETHADALAFEAYASGVKAARYRSRGAAQRSSLAAILEGYREPVLFIYGEHDVTGTPELAKTMLADAALRREFEIIPDGGHWIQFEQAEATHDALARWLGFQRSPRLRELRELRG